MFKTKAGVGIAAAIQFFSRQQCQEPKIILPSPFSEDSAFIRVRAEWVKELVSAGAECQHIIEREEASQRFHLNWTSVDQRLVFEWQLQLMSEPKICGLSLQMQKHSVCQ